MNSRRVEERVHPVREHRIELTQIEFIGDKILKGKTYSDILVLDVSKHGMGCLMQENTMLYPSIRDNLRFKTQQFYEVRWTEENNMTNEIRFGLMRKSDN